MRAASIDVVRLLADHQKEMEESARIRAQALQAAARAQRVKDSVDRMNRLYRDRLVGIRKPPDRGDGA